MEPFVTIITPTYNLLENNQEMRVQLFYHLLPEQHRSVNLQCFPYNNASVG